MSKLLIQHFYFLLSGSAVHCCSFTEALIRLVLSAVVGLATVVILVDHFRSMKVEQKLREQTLLSVPQ